jgi:5-(aminomethyl)-3-furanmethanol phosphate kinase
MDIVVAKVGGSLASQPDKLRALIQKLDELSKKHPLIIVPGGGEFADTVRELDSRFGLTSQTSHFMAMLAMDQFGILLSSLSNKATTTTKLERVKDLFQLDFMPIFLPSQLFFFKDPLENSWDVTSDSIALYIGSVVRASKVLLITDVDGVYTSDPKVDRTAKLIHQLSAKGLAALGRTSVDKAFPRLLGQNKIVSFVVNGLFPERVEAVLEDKETVCTRIYG